MQLTPLLFAALALSPAPQPPATPVVWEVLSVERAWSEGETSMTTLGPVVEVRGKPVEEDVQFVEVDTELTGITGFRLEALGPGKGRGGQFRLAEVSLLAAPSNRVTQMAPVLLLHAAGVAQKPKHPVYFATDNNTRSAWHGSKKNGIAFFECAAPVGHKKGTRLRFTFEYIGCGRDTLGRFRLSATVDPRPLRDIGHPLGDEWAATQGRINEAIDRGVRRLLDQQERDGSWKQHQPRFRTGQTALSLYTLIKSGVSINDDAVRRALAFLGSHPADETYSLSVQILALSAAGFEKHRKQITEGVKRLISWQRRGYGYPGGNIDLSNTQYAALALWIGARNGLPVPRSVWEDLIKQTLRHQQGRPKGKSGAATFPLGFSYRPLGQPTGSMTAAGVAILAICQHQLSRTKGAAQAALERGVAWLAQYYSPTLNAVVREPLEHHPQKGHFHYYLYGLERVGGLLDRALLGPHDWYRKGALALLDSQQDNGGFGDQTNTCFGVLFLVRATRPTPRGPVTGMSSSRVGKTWGRDDPKAPVSIRAGGRAPLTVWLSSYGAETRRKHEWPREKKRGPRVIGVKYFAAPSDARDKKQLIATVNGDVGKPAEKKTFAAQHKFTKFGYWILTAEVLVAPRPKGKGKGKGKGKPVVLKSPPVEVLVRDPKEDLKPGELYSYALDPLHNLMPGAKAKASASTKRGGWEPALVFDNLHARGWMSAKEDENPWILLELDKPVRANTVLLSQCHDFTVTRPPTTAAFTRVRMDINGRSHEVKMALDPRRKTTFELPKAVRVRTLKVSILDRTRNDVGLAEIELQMRKAKR